MKAKKQLKYTTEEEIKEEIIRRYEQGLELRSTELKKEGEGELYTSGNYKFGTWKNALKESGIPDNEIKDLLKWGEFPTKSSVIKEIKNRHELGLGFKTTELRRDNVEVLYRRGVKLFGSWENTLIESGIDRDEIDILLSRKKYKTKQAITKRIRELYEDGVRVSESNIYLEDAGLVNNAKDVFGNWITALRESQIPEELIAELLGYTRFSSPKKVMDEIQLRVDSGKGLRYADVKADGDFQLYRKGREFFGSWKNTLKAFGIKGDELVTAMKTPKKDNSELVKKFIRDRHKEGKGLRRKDLADEGLLGLYGKAKRQYGTWEEALRQSGVPGNEGKNLNS